jgi:hypothetical protein
MSAAAAECAMTNELAVASKAATAPACARRRGWYGRLGMNNPLSAKTAAFDRPRTARLKQSFYEAKTTVF